MVLNARFLFKAADACLSVVELVKTYVFSSVDKANNIATLNLGNVPNPCKILSDLIRSVENNFQQSVFFTDKLTRNNLVFSHKLILPTHLFLL